MNAKKITGWLIVIFLAWFVISSPQSAAHFLTGTLLPAVKTVGNSVATFFTSL